MRVMLQCLQKNTYSVEEYLRFLDDPKLLTIRSFDSNDPDELFPDEVLAADANCLKLMSLKLKISIDVQSKISAKNLRETRRCSNRISQEVAIKQLRGLPFSVTNVDPGLQIVGDDTFVSMNIRSLLQTAKIGGANTVEKLYSALRHVLIHCTHDAKAIKRFTHCIGDRPPKKFHKLPQSVVTVLEDLIMQLPGLVGSVFDENAVDEQIRYPHQWYGLGHNEEDRFAKHHNVSLLREKLLDVKGKIISTTLNSLRRCPIDVIQHATHQERRLLKRGPDGDMNDLLSEDDAPLHDENSE